MEAGGEDEFFKGPPKSRPSSYFGGLTACHVSSWQLRSTALDPAQGWEGRRAGQAPGRRSPSEPGEQAASEGRSAALPQPGADSGIPLTT